MRRALAIAALFLATGAFFVFATGAGEDSGGTKYTVELDNAFGLIEGADIKVGGVRAGKITDMNLDRRTKRALIEFELTETGFGSLREDVECQLRPQSLIGEYFVDCLPGTSRIAWPPSKTIPVEKTSSTVPPDLVNSILRRPYRERLRIIVNEFGAATAGNGANLNTAIKRAAPGLRETNRVLAILARQNTVLRDLAKNGDTVLKELRDNRKDVARWVVESRDTARASARRERELAEQFEEFPGFLRELRPTMAALGDVATRQTPVLEDLDASANQLERFFDNLGPFANASRPAIRSLGRASKIGDRAVKAGRPTISELRRMSRKTPELANNLDIALGYADSRRSAVEENPFVNQQNPDAPPGSGFTALEALFQYVFDQTMTINIFDRNTHILKVAIFASETCGPFADHERARHHPECASWLGPNQPGITTPDPSPGGGWPNNPADKPQQQARTRGRENRRETATSPTPPPPPARSQAPSSQGPTGLLGEILDGLTGGGSRQQTPGLGALDGLLGGGGSRTTSPAASTGAATGPLLDYLLAP